MGSTPKIKSIARCLFCLFISLHLQAHARAQDAHIDRLKTELARTQNDTLKLKYCGMLAEEYNELQPDSTLRYCFLLLEIAQKHNFKLKEVYAKGMIGYSLMNKAELPQALKILQEALALAEDSTIEQTILPEPFQDDEGWQNHTNNGHLLRLDELAGIHLKLGVLYENAKKFNEEKEEFLKGIKIAEEAGTLSVQSTLYSTLGKAYLLLAKNDSSLYDSALLAEQKAFELSERSHFLRYRTTILLNMGRIYMAKGESASALANFNRAIAASLRTRYMRGVAASNLAIAELFVNNGRPDSSLVYANRAFAISENIENPGLILRSYQAKAAAFKDMRKNDSAVKYLSLIIQMNDNQFSSKQTQLFETVKFDEELRKQETETARKEYRNKLQTLILIAVLTIFFLLAIGLWFNNKQKQKAFAILEKQKKEIDIQKAKAEQALDELKTTQSQLVQREKMASLGELTAGIAHEIQNPLNFVNNFSELNTELVGDLQKELKSANIPEAFSISERIQENEEKIVHHGKRADAIVKGMLQHSRSGAGHKEMTDINALADEYFRLSYHGFRAKEKGFNVRLHTDFDPEINQINILPRDIGSVLLNLFNNAFYAVSEKKKRTSATKGVNNEYEPAVGLTTKLIQSSLIEGVSRCVEIRVKDNGIGIPSKNLEKIFQPFFTTKPTGMGTGLGLSLSYDIIKAHGGEIRTNTREGEFTEFIIQLPA